MRLRCWTCGHGLALGTLLVVALATAHQWVGALPRVPLQHLQQRLGPAVQAQAGGSPAPLVVSARGRVAEHEGHLERTGFQNSTGALQACRYIHAASWPPTHPGPSCCDLRQLCVVHLPGLLDGVDVGLEHRGLDAEGDIAVHLPPVDGASRALGSLVPHLEGRGGVGGVGQPCAPPCEDWMDGPASRSQGLLHAAGSAGRDTHTLIAAVTCPQMLQAEGCHEGSLRSLW